MSVSGTPVATYYDGFPKAHPSLPAAHDSLAPRVLDPTVSTAERAGGVGGALGNPSSYVGTGVPATDRRAVGQTVRSGFPRPHPPHPPGGSAAIGSPQFRTETLRSAGSPPRPPCGGHLRHPGVTRRAPSQSRSRVTRIAQAEAEGVDFG